MPDLASEARAVGPDMANVSGRSSKGRSALKLAGLLLFVGGVGYAVHALGLAQYLKQERIEALLAPLGVLAPLGFVVLYALSICLFLPGTLLSGLGAVLFGSALGTAVNWTGATIGATASFFIGRYLGRDFAHGLVQRVGLQKYDEAFARNGFAAILYLRLLWFPFTPLNFGAGLTKIRARDYILGTAFGILPGSFIFTFAIAEVKRAIELLTTEGTLAGFVAPKVLVAVALFAGSFFIPTIIKRIWPEQANPREATG